MNHFLYFYFMPGFYSIAAFLFTVVLASAPTTICAQGSEVQLTSDPAIASFSTYSVQGNEALISVEESGFSWISGADAVSSYVWRGTRQGRGPHLQPYAECSWGLFTGGIWGTFDFNGYREVDLYLSTDLPGGFTIGLQDYWMADLPWDDFTAESGSHAVEASLGYESEHVGLNANYVINEAGGAGSAGGDIYIESRFSFDYFSVIMGAGNGWHTGEGGFRVCNLGLEVSLEIPVTDRFLIPVTLQTVYNPDSDRLFLTAGLSVSVGSDNN